MSEDLLVETREPKVGIFWILNGNVIDYAYSVRSVESVGGFRDSPIDHIDAWKSVQGLYPQLRKKEYIDIPRGRVLYVETQKVFRIITNRAISGNRPLVAKIMRVFSLPPTTVVVIDPHYEDDFDLDD